MPASPPSRTVVALGLLLLPAPSSGTPPPVEIRPGAIAIDGSFLAFGGTTSDIADVYNRHYDVRAGGTAMIGYGIGASYAVTSRLQLGASFDILRKKLEVEKIIASYPEPDRTWTLPACRIMARGRFHVVDLPFSIFPEADVATSIHAGAGAGILSLCGATMEEEGVTGSLDVTGTGPGGVIEIIMDTHVNEILAVSLGVGYQLGSIKPVTRSGRLGSSVYPEQTLLTQVREKARVDYAGPVIRVSLRAYVWNPDETRPQGSPAAPGLAGGER